MSEIALRIMGLLGGVGGTGYTVVDMRDGVQINLPERINGADAVRIHPATGDRFDVLFGCVQGLTVQVSIAVNIRADRLAGLLQEMLT